MKNSVKSRFYFVMLMVSLSLAQAYVVHAHNLFIPRLQRKKIIPHRFMVISGVITPKSHL